MKMLKRTAVALCVVPMMMFAGCGEHEAVKAMNDFADEICACKDAKCLTDATKKFSELTKKYGDEKVSQGDADKIKAATEKITKCMTELPAKMGK